MFTGVIFISIARTCLSSDKNQFQREKQKMGNIRDRGESIGQLARKETGI